MPKDIIYYILDKNTHLYRFHANGTVLYMIVEGNVLNKRELIFNLFNESIYVYKGKFHTDGNKISFDIETNGDFHIYQGNILNTGKLQLVIYDLNSGKKGQVTLQPLDSSIHFDWKNSKYNSDTSSILDLRLSTFKQLQHLLGEANVFYIATGFLEDSDTTFLNIMNDFLNTASKELPGAQVKIENNWLIDYGNNNYVINVDDRIQYIDKNQILKDFNAILEAQNSQKRFFYFDDNGDNDVNCSYFYTDRDRGLQIIEFLNTPPFYPYNDFTDHSCNRVINMKFIDSTTEKEAKYFKRLIPDF